MQTKFYTFTPKLANGSGRGSPNTGLPVRETDMSNLALYSIAVLVWGSTWLLINYQLGEVAPEASVGGQKFEYEAYD